MWISLLVMSTITTYGFHKYYVSITTIDVNVEDGTLECSIKMFTDDLERAIEASGRYDVSITEYGSDKLVDSLIMDYVCRRLSIRYGTPSLEETHREYPLLACRPVGFETDVDLTWVYIEYKQPGNETYAIKNACLTEVFEEQQNIVHIRKEGKVVKSLLMGKGDDFKEFPID